MRRWQREIIIGIILLVVAAGGLCAKYGGGFDYDNYIQPGEYDPNASNQPEYLNSSNSSQSEYFDQNNSTSSDSDSSDADRLRSLPYVSWNPVDKEDESKMGVVSYIAEKCMNGINLYDSQAYHTGDIMDMKGNILHTWSCDLGKWATEDIDKEGNLYVIIDGKMLCKLDWDSRMIWSCKSGFHHWVSLAENGDIYSLVWDRLDIKHRGRTIPILNDYITILSRDGKIKKQLSMYKMFGDRIPERNLDAIYNAEYTGASWVDPVNPEESYTDVFHSNTVEKIERDVPGLCKKGDILVSMRNIDLIAIIDPVSEKVLWSWGYGIMDRQHSPELTEKGTIVVFDNGPRKRGYSRILEVDPKTRKIVFEYKADPPESFLSRSGGTVQNLGNGNVLITESERGKAFEVTRSGETVWEYFYPNTNEDMRGSIHRMMRLDPEIAQSIKKKLAKEREL
ncbi:MAG: arylsulfotransferase family protein [Candidatus Xenobiia bacterium LiM19]